MGLALRTATHARHYQEAPQAVDEDGTRHWITRAANFVVVVTDAAKGAVLARADNPDEYMVLLPKTQATVEASGVRVEAKGESLSIMPPGSSRVTVTAPGIVVRVFSNKAGDVVSAASNAATYADGAPEVAPIVYWPDPVGGYRLRYYPVGEMESPDPTTLKMRLFRSTNLMINIFKQWSQRRNEKQLSPHSHEDFEQVSLALQGSFVHHLRYPWGPDKTKWHKDEHEHYESPSVLVIPPHVIHTTQDVGGGATWLIDIFGPPRVDFSSRAGFILNEADYPMRPGT